MEGADHFIESVLQPNRLKYADYDEMPYKEAEPSPFFNPEEFRALQQFNEGKDVARISNS